MMRTPASGLRLLAAALVLWPLSCGPEARLPGRARQLTVAAVQYAPGAYVRVAPRCTESDAPDLCAVVHLVARAARQGAQLVVTPEYGLPQSKPEPAPRLGQNPGAAASWPGPLLRTFSRQASRHGIYLIVNLLTTEPAAHRPKTHNTQVAFGPSGAVRAVHHKLTLYDTEAQTLTPGRRVTVLPTPFGPVGLLICADLYGDLRQHQRLVRDAGARLVAVSAAWTASGGVRWPRSFARNWGVYVVSANTTAGPGAGGGVFDPTGRTLVARSDPGLTIVTLPTAPSDPFRRSSP